MPSRPGADQREAPNEVLSLGRARHAHPHHVRRRHGPRRLTLPRQHRHHRRRLGQEQLPLGRRGRRHLGHRLGLGRQRLRGLGRRQGHLPRQGLLRRRRPAVRAGRHPAQRELRAEWRRQGQDQRPRGRRHHPLRDHQPAGRQLAEQQRRRLALHQQGPRLGEAAWKFSGADLRPEGFVHFAASGDGVSGGYVYMTAMRSGAAPKAVYLMRAPSSQLASKSAYQYYNGSSWGTSPGAARPVFADAAGTNGPSILYDEGLRRYILTLAHGANCGRFGMFEAASLTGPWFTVEYEDHWLGVSGGDFLGAQLPSRWVQDRGRTLWAVFSCYGNGSGVFHDKLNLMKATLKVAGG